MSLSQHLAKHLRDVHFGGNWTSVNMKDILADVSWQQATTKVQSLNTIATLVNHINYYVAAVSKVLEGEALNAKDAFSFSHLPIDGPEDWQKLVDKLFVGAEHFAKLIAQIPEARLWQDFTDAKYGSYYRNIQGIIEHTHYHLGQIVIIKKMLDTQ